MPPKQGTWVPPKRSWRRKGNKMSERGNKRRRRVRLSNIVETICPSETSETEDTSSDNCSVASEDDDLRARRAGSDKEQRL